MTRTVFKVEGMMCPMCEAHVNDAVRRAFEVAGVRVKSVSSSRKRGETEVLCEAKFDAEAIKSAIEQTGYKVTGISSEEIAEKKGFFGRLFSK